MQTALIVGAGGQDGRLLTQFLQRRGYRVNGWIRRKSTGQLPCQCLVMDLLDRTSIEREMQTLRPREIYYLAAHHHSTEEAADFDTSDLLQRSFEVHVEGLVNVLRAIKRHRVDTRLFYASSSHVFGKCAEDWADEKTPFRPDSAYGISKLAGMRCCDLIRTQDHIFASTGILFHHDSAWRKASFVSQRIVRGALQARQDPRIKIAIGSLDARIDWGYAPDYVDAMFRITQLSEPGDFVVSSGELHSVQEFIEAAFEEVDLDWREHVQIEPELLKRPSHPLRGNSAKLRTSTGWAPSVEFRELVGRLVWETEKLHAIT